MHECILLGDESASSYSAVFDFEVCSHEHRAIESVLFRILILGVKCFPFHIS